MPLQSLLTGYSTLYRAVLHHIVTALTKGLVCGSCRRFAGMLVAEETDLKLHITGGAFSALQQESHITGYPKTGRSLDIMLHLVK
ncbi:hypothetical protein Q7C36_009591 [Tachysurus vachellii]|uniref:Uncharacterized protein n=1 Tax=Tachysurus vachellii TaxID=175792 RepID=A0AA88MYF5_TACVA|nr:hypothetical protein Q7C36_009591 [Tachysurus vachellii]